MDTPQSPPDILDRIRIVLVEPKHPGNIGAVARAMKNMGLTRLYLVNPCDFRSAPARKMAHGSGDILYQAAVCPTLHDALTGVVLSVGTTHRTRRHLDLYYGPRYAAQKLTRLPACAEGALVFGREESGLTNEELQHCQLISRIPTARSYPSLNLAQAALLFAYELYQAAAEPAETPELDLAPFEEMESLYAHISSSLDKLGFTPKNHPQSFIRSIRRIFGRIPMERRDTATIHKIFRQIDKFVARHRLNVKNRETDG